MPAGEGLRRLARKSVAALATELTAAAGGGSVHGARRQLKFLRSLIRLMRHGLGEAEFAAANAHLRDAGRRLAAARQAEAMQECIAKLAGAAAANSPALAQLAAAASVPAIAGPDPKDLPTAIAAARREIEKVRSAIGDWHLPQNRPRLFVEGLRDCHGKARKTLARGLKRDDPAVLHEARKSVIHHLHHLDILSPLWPKMLDVLRGEFAALREALGDLNDLAELEDLLHTEGSPFAAINAKTEARDIIARRRNKLLHDAKGHAHRLFAEKPGPFARRIGALWRMRPG